MGIVAGLSGVTGVGKVKPPGISQTSQDYLGLLKEGYMPGAEQLVSSAETLLPRYSRLYLSQAEQATPDVNRILAGANPELESLLSKIMSSAGQDSLNYGGALPRGLLRLTNQYSRAGQAARGLGYGPSDVYGETGDAARLSAELTDRNRAYATGAANLSYNVHTDPFMRLMAGTVGAGANSLLNPKDTLSLLLAPYQARLSAATSSAANKTNLMSEASRGFDAGMFKI